MPWVPVLLPARGRPSEPVVPHLSAVNNCTSLGCCEGDMRCVCCMSSAVWGPSGESEETSSPFTSGSCPSFSLCYWKTLQSMWLGALSRYNGLFLRTTTKTFCFYKEERELNRGAKYSSKKSLEGSSSKGNLQLEGPVLILLK